MKQRTSLLKNSLLLLWLLAATLFVWFTLASSWAKPSWLALPAARGMEETAVANTNPVANCRYGVTPGTGSDPVWVSPLGAGWFLNFHVNNLPPLDNNAEHVQVIRLKQNKTANGTYLPTYTITPALGSSTLNNIITNKPGSLWIVGNEVDRGPNPNDTVSIQDDTFPQIYAQAYHDVYYYLKQRDPTARVANSALVQVTPGRLQYLDLMWQAYIDRYGVSMPVDVWNMHIYILPEATSEGQPNSIASIALGTDPALAKRESGGNPAVCALDSVYCYAEHDDMHVFAQQVIAMRQWMKNHGQQEKPLILSEYSLLYPYEIDGTSCFLQDEFGNCFTPQRVKTFLLNSFTYLENTKDPNLGYLADDNRLIQQWLWFSINSNPLGKVSNLTNDNGSSLSDLGLTYQSHVQQITPTKNLIISKIQPDVVFTNGAGSATATLTATILNNGNTQVVEPFMVTFYADVTRTLPIGSAMMPGGLRGCATSTVTATVNWDKLAPGKHVFWVLADSEDVVLESPTGITDNFGSGIVLVDPHQVSLPLIQR